jgi:flagellar hook-length control protein FliK
MFVLPLAVPAAPADPDGAPSGSDGVDFAAVPAAPAGVVPGPAAPPAAVPAPGTPGSAPEGPAVPTVAGAPQADVPPVLTAPPAATAPVPEEVGRGGATVADAAAEAPMTAAPGAAASVPAEPVPPPDAPPPPSHRPAAHTETPQFSGPETGPAGGAHGAGVPAPPTDDPVESRRGPARVRFPALTTLEGGRLRPGGGAAVVDRSEPAARPEHPSLPDQVVSVVEPLRHRGDGHHELTLDLRPPELGPIRVEVTIEGGTVHLSLHAGDAATGDLLHQAMPDLRAALAEAGLVAGHLGVGSGEQDAGHRARPAAPEPGERRSPRARPVETLPAPARAASSGAIDLLL